MAVSPAAGHPLTLEHRGEAARYEDIIDAHVIGNRLNGGAPIATVPLPGLPPPAVRSELRCRYQSAGWKRVVFHKRASDGAAVVELDALTDRRLAEEPL